MQIPPSHLGPLLYRYPRRFNRTISRVLSITTWNLFDRVCSWGVVSDMHEYEKKKLVIFNRLNIFQLLLSVLIPICCVLGHQQLSLSVYISLFMPACLSAGILLLNRSQLYNSALYSYFLLYPIIISSIYMTGMDFGLELYFIFFGILSVFFLKDIGLMIFSISLSMVSYFVLSVVWKNYVFKLETEQPGIFLAIQLLAIVLIFYGLYLIKDENSRYQFRILAKNHILQLKNEQIQEQNKEINDKAAELETQTARLKEINNVKNKLFTVIAHDLKAPVYALRNIFQHIHDYNMPAQEIKELVPDMVADLAYTTELMDNLLQWAKTQMGGNIVNITHIDISETSMKIARTLRSQAQSKQIIIEDTVSPGTFVTGDMDMISLVMRNLVSNAIKYTPVNGRVIIGAKETRNSVEIFVKDTGVGMTKGTLARINACEFYTSKGTSNESGTGLGLMLSREFILMNGGQMNIKSRVGKGSVFSFTLPQAAGLTKAV